MAGNAALGREDGEGDERADDAGQRDGRDAGPDHGRRVPREGPGRPRRR